MPCLGLGPTSSSAVARSRMRSRSRLRRESARRSAPTGERFRRTAGASASRGRSGLPGRAGPCGQGIRRSSGSSSRGRLRSDQAAHPRKRAQSCGAGPRRILGLGCSQGPPCCTCVPDFVVIGQSVARQRLIHQSGKSVGWLERSETQQLAARGYADAGFRSSAHRERWVSLRSTHPAVAPLKPSGSHRLRRPLRRHPQGPIPRLV